MCLECDQSVFPLHCLTVVTTEDLSRRLRSVDRSGRPGGSSSDWGHQSSRPRRVAPRAPAQVRQPDSIHSPFQTGGRWVVLRSSRLRLLQLCCHRAWPGACRPLGTSTSADSLPSASTPPWTGAQGTRAAGPVDGHRTTSSSSCGARVLPNPLSLDCSPEH